jgi:hypothetical protein
MNSLTDALLFGSWGKNAAAWTAAVPGGQIESCELATNGSNV